MSSCVRLKLTHLLKTSFHQAEISIAQIQIARLIYTRTQHTLDMAVLDCGKDQVSEI